MLYQAVEYYCFEKQNGDFLTPSLGKSEIKLKCMIQQRLDSPGSGQRETNTGCIGMAYYSPCRSTIGPKWT